MSKQELVEAYVEGRVSRRVFMRRLVAAGVSLGAASAYAAALAPVARSTNPPQVPGDLHNFYGDLHRSAAGDFYSSFGKSHNPNAPFTSGKGHKGE